MQVIGDDHLLDVHEDLSTLATATSGVPMGPWDERASGGWSSIVHSVSVRVDQGHYNLAQSAAAILVRGATTQHLYDGNKRMATAAMNAQLIWNGYEFHGDDVTMAEFTELIAMTRATDLDGVVRLSSQFLDRHIKPLHRVRIDPFARLRSGD